jgi:hypothetical protein
MHYYFGATTVYQTLKEMLVEWNATHTERTKLQHTYLAVSIFGIVLAGLIGLLDYEASRAILRICFAGIGIFVANAIVWALLFSLIINKLPKRNRR